MSFVYSSVSPICVGGSSFLYYAYASYIVLGMDFKDNAWTWNIQKKFNVVRQEVDEFVGVETMKYVENQVQTLGGTVKGFCSNVFQDFLSPALSNPVYHDEGTVPQEGKFVSETYKNSVSNLREKYADTDSKSLSSALSNPVDLDAELVPQKGKDLSQNYNKPLFVIEEKYADIASKQIYTNQDSVHHMPPPYRLNNVKKTMPTEGDNEITKALLPSVRDDSALYDNVKTSVSGYVVSDCEGLVAKERYMSEDSNLDFEELVAKERSLSENLNLDFERLVAKERSLSEGSNSDFEGLIANERSLSDDLISDFEGLIAKEKSLFEDSNSIGINDEASLIFVTNEDHSHKIIDEVVFAAVEDSVRVCSSVKERTFDPFFDDCHCKILGTPQSSEAECSISSGCQVVEPTLFSSISSLSNNSYYQSECFTLPEESVFYDHTDSVNLNMKTIDLSEKKRLNKSCIIEDNELLGATSFRPRRHRSYKQMIKDAYTKSKRLAKEYELLGIMYEDIDNELVQHERDSKLPSTHEKTPETGHSPTEDSGDCDWELL
ncbi:hypothetical protein DCAR_0417942 [Daucus carota subsp. sativus]|uniref:Uncharacterized protein n=1 Tax=Daucus carota subsp. sativus TaxID=79200 RepID=A0AAF0X1N4_DAUCS|nr:hypothetical protein DCAR_0417942 [Daucus carota subsp. sativus]